MSSDYFYAEKAPAPGGSYSHGVVANGLLFTCGMGPNDPSTGKSLLEELANRHVRR